LSGALLQALLRNTLACPYTLGISGGAALGAASVILLGWADRFAQFPVVTLAALAGAALTTSFVAALAARGGLSPQSLLLAGVSLNSLCFAAMLLVQHAAGLAQSFAIGRWLLGGIDPVSSTVLLTLAVTLGAAVLLVFRSAGSWNQLALGDEWAAARGVDAGGLRLQGLVVASLLAALVTSFTGPIGFVGLLVPNAVRLLLGPDHRVLLPASALWGSVLLIGCDTLGRILAPPSEIPAGILTALAGAPFLVFLLGSRAVQRP
jgi:iron complex transport system permease protein